MSEAGAGAGAGERHVPVAEGRPDPYWSDPREEEPRWQRVRAAIGGGPIPGRNFAYEGLRAYGRNPDNIVFIVGKSQNDNVVIYEYLPPTKDTELRVVAYWLSIEPSARAEHLAQGNPSLMSALSPLEQQGYGTNMQRIVNNDGSKRYLFNVRAEQLRKYVFDLMVDAKGQPFLGGTIAGQQAIAERAYLQMRRGLTSLTLLSSSAAEEIRLYGRKINTEGIVVESIHPT